MPLDGIVLNCITNTLNETLINGRVDKIHQTEKDELFFTVRNNGKNYKLLITASSNYPRIHVTKNIKSNPIKPPVFCMLLRKHLTGSRIREIKQLNFDRIVEIVFETKDELESIHYKSFIIEIMGKHSNIILINTESRNIIDSIKRISQNISSKRQIYPGLVYSAPPSKLKYNPLNINKKDFMNLLNKTRQGIVLYKYFYQTFNGISPLISKEICFLSQVDESMTLAEIDESISNRLWLNFNIMFDKVNQNNFSPSIYINNNSYYDFHCFDLNHIEMDDKINYTSINELLDVFYFKRDNINRLKQKSANMLKTINTKLDRNIKKLAKQKQDLFNAEDREKYRIYGDLIISNIHMINKSSTNITVQNYYDEKGTSTITIPLDPRLNPSQNAQKHYKKYNKLKKAEEELVKLIQYTENEIFYLENIIYNIEQCSNINEIEEIREELSAQGFIKKKKVSKKSSTKGSKPLSFVSSKGHEILVGKNNKQNDLLTFKISRKDDLWLHTKNIPGSHVILRTNGDDIDDSELLEAARLAAYYSKARNSDNVEIDYTKRINVKKPNGSKPGFVIYENYYTVIVNPNINDIKVKE